MAQTAEAAKKVAPTLYKKYGEDYFKIIGAKGGKFKGKKGFAVSGLARSAGAKGGLVKRSQSDKAIQEA